MARVYPLHCELIRFLNCTSEGRIREEVEDVFAAAFKSLQVQSVVRSGVKYSTPEAIHKLGDQVEKLQKPLVFQGNALELIQKKNLTMEICNGVRTFGFEFKIEQPLRSFGCDWFYRYGPLPYSEFGALYYEDYQSPEKWAKELLASEAVHVVRTRTHFLRRSSFYGRGDHLYLLWKRWRQRWKPVKTEEAMEASLALRELCKIVWNKRNSNLDKLESPKWRPWHGYLIRRFDQALIKEAGLEKLRKILGAMDFTVDRWLSI